MENIQNIVKILISQHRILQQNLSNTNDLAKADGFVAKSIIESLNSFTKNLLGHLKLENEIFYPQLLQKMKEKKMETADTQKFIKQMKIIEAAVKDFLGKYSVESAFEKSIDIFRKELGEIIRTLNLRIESEEEGVFSYWAFF